MNRIELRVVDVYPYRVVGGTVEFLLLRRSPGRPYAGAWRMVGGRIEDGETAWRAALRELEEETGCPAAEFWTVPSVNAFYEWREDRISLAPAFAARIDRDPRLDDEHDAFAWLSPEAAAARLDWPEQARMIRLITERITHGIPPELVVGT